MAKIGMAKDLCRVPFWPEHGVTFVVCLSARNTEKQIDGIPY
jgi:hypothetical protein